jgi:hypothetical protein
MNKRAAEIAKAISRLPYDSRLTDKNLAILKECIERTARSLAKRLNTELRIDNGSTGREARLYVEWIGNRNRNLLHDKCCVAECFSWITSRYISYGGGVRKLGFQPIPMKSILKLCDDLMKLPPVYYRKRNPTKMR